MANKGTQKVLGTIGAMKTFTEQFPSALLDDIRTKRYDSVLDFLIDVLTSCGVSYEDIACTVIEKIFGFGAGVNFTAESLYQAISEMNVEENSKFLEGLENSMKAILMGLLSGIFSCSAIPILPDKYMDTGKDDPRMPRNYIRNSPNLSIPVKSFDITGMLDISPLSRLGKLYYNQDGSDTYYRKVKRTEMVERTQGVPYDVYVCDDFVPVGMAFDYGYHYNFVHYSNDYKDDVIYFTLDSPLPYDLNITVEYDSKIGESSTETLKILAGEVKSPTMHLTPMDVDNNYDTVYRILLNGELGGCVVGTSYAYLSLPFSTEVCNFWENKGNTSLLGNVTWGDVSMCPTETITPEVTGYDEVDVYSYQPTNGVVYQDAIRYEAIPDEVSASDPDHVVVYEGLKNTSLNKTYDLNSFIWYIMNYGSVVPQFEYNKMMWDSRLSAREVGFVRDDAASWNEWYNSKTDEDDEFDSVINGEDTSEALFPILQFEKGPGDSVTLKFPAQKWYKPNAKDTDSSFVYNGIRLNKTLYEFNWEYLQNIKIFNPKTLLFTMFNRLMNGSLATAAGVTISLERRVILQKLSTAIKRYIEAVDTQIDDCYFTFSNDEYDAMLAQGLISSYDAVQTGGETNPAMQYNADQYMAMIDSAAASASKSGTTSLIIRTITEVSSDKPTEPTIDYGIIFGYDAGIWKAIVEAIVMALVEAIFTPQVMLLVMINFIIMGVVKPEDVFGVDNGAFMNLLVNKTFTLVKSLVGFVKDKIAEILLELFYEKVLPMVTTYKALLMLEKLRRWMAILAGAIACLPKWIGFFKKKRIKTQINDVDYADIVNDVALPGEITNC